MGGWGEEPGAGAYALVTITVSFVSFPTPARGNANGICEFIKQKEKRGCCYSRCLCTRHIKAAVCAAEREINQGRDRKEEDRRRLKQTAGNQVRVHHASGRQCAEPSLDRERVRCA